MFGTKLTPEEKAAKDRKKAADRAERHRLQKIADARRAEERDARFAKMPEFVVRESREVTVKAENMQDAIALAAAAFKEGQDDDHTIKWRRPYGVEGDTIDKIRVINVKAAQLDE